MHHEYSNHYQLTAITINTKLNAFCYIINSISFFFLEKIIIIFFYSFHKTLVAFWIFFSFQIPKIKTRLGDCEAT